MRINELRYVENPPSKNDMFIQMKHRWDYTNYTEDDNGNEIKVILGKISGYDLYVRNENRTQMIQIYDVINNGVAGYVELVRLNNSYSIQETVVNKEYLGLGLATKVYAYLIKNKNYTLWSTDAQTKGGKTIWEKLAKIPGILVFAWDDKKKEAISLDKNDLFGETDLYDTDVEYDEKKFKSLEAEQKRIWAEFMKFKNIPKSAKKTALWNQYNKLSKQKKQLTTDRTYVEQNMTLVAQKD